MRDHFPVEISSSALFRLICERFHEWGHVRSAVLFGSAAASRFRPELGRKRAADFDFHVVTSSPDALEALDWKTEFGRLGYSLHICRKATGGVRKLTIVCTEGQIDIVLVPHFAMRLASLAILFDLQRRFAPIRLALNEMATCLHSGYTFIKGESVWGELYTNVSQLPGIRLSNMEIQKMADAFLIDALWVLQKINAGELVAAQHVLHCKLVETNLRLWRELRLRKGYSFSSFGLGRRAEQIATSDEQACFSLTCAEGGDLRLSAFAMLQGVRTLMSRLNPEWSVPTSMQTLLDSHQT